MTIELRNRFFAGKYRVGKGVANYSGIDNQDLINCENLDELISSPSAINSVVNNEIAMNLIGNNQSAMESVTNSEIAMNAISNSQVAIDFIKKNDIAMSAISNSQLGMESLLNNELSMNAIGDSPFLGNYILSSPYVTDLIWDKEEKAEEFYNIMFGELPVPKDSEYDFEDPAGRFSLETRSDKLALKVLVKGQKDRANLYWYPDVTGVKRILFDYERNAGAAGYYLVDFSIDGDRRRRLSAESASGTTSVDVSGESGIVTFRIHMGGVQFSGESTNYFYNFRFERE